MKKLIIFIFCFLLLMNFPVLADSSPTVGGGNYSIAAVKSTAVSVNIKDNPGLMGFKIALKYDINILNITEVKAGTVTKNGNFNCNYDTPGNLLVVWANTEEVKTDGSLFDIHFSVLDNYKDTEITLTYSQNDTFNEKYQNVALNVLSIQLTGGRQTAEQPTASTVESTVSSTVSETTEHSGLDEYSAEEKKAVIDSFLQENGLQSTDELSSSQKKQLIDELKEKFPIDNPTLSDDEKEALYENEIASEEENSESIRQNQESGSGKTKLFLIIPVIILVAGAAVCIIIFKKKVR